MPVTTGSLTAFRFLLQYGTVEVFKFLPVYRQDNVTSPLTAKGASLVHVLSRQHAASFHLGVSGVYPIQYRDVLMLKLQRTYYCKIRFDPSIIDLPPSLLAFRVRSTSSSLSCTTPVKHLRMMRSKV